MVPYQKNIFLCVATASISFPNFGYIEKCFPFRILFLFSLLSWASRCVFAGESNIQLTSNILRHTSSYISTMLCLFSLASRYYTALCIREQCHYYRCAKSRQSIRHQRARSVRTILLMDLGDFPRPSYPHVVYSKFLRKKSLFLCPSPNFLEGNLSLNSLKLPTLKWKSTQKYGHSKSQEWRFNFINSSSQ